MTAVGPTTTRAVPVDGLVFSVRLTGREEGDPVVLLHGFPQDGTCWDGVVPALAAAGHRVVVPDLRGASPAARPEGRRHYRFPRLVADVLGLLDGLGLARVHLVGHDWGGALGWALAGAHPDRLRSLVAVSTPHPAAMVWSLPRSAQALRSAYVGFFNVPILSEAVLGAGGATVLRRMLTASGCPPRFADHYAAINADRARLRAALSWYRGVAPGDLRGIAPAAVPTRFVWGREDPALGGVAARNTVRFVDAPYRFDEVEAGHWLPETMADDLARRILDHVDEAARTRP